MKPPSAPSWRARLEAEFRAPYWRELRAFVEAERKQAVVYPPPADVFAALEHTPYDAVRVMILGQDPYHGPGQAHGLAFSVRPGVKPPPSLRNVFKELHDDVGCPIPAHGYLLPWAERGVLLLNAVLTVRQGEPNSHAGRGWERFTDAVIRELSAREAPVVFVLWGAYAGRKEALIDTARHPVVRSTHPSPLSARRGFLGSRPFSAIDVHLAALGQDPIDWCLPDRP